MSDKLKIALWVVLGIVGAILLFSLIVCISCSVNGLTFGEQVCDWFGANKPAVDAGAEAIKEIAETTLA